MTLKLIWLPFLVIMFSSGITGCNDEQAAYRRGYDAGMTAGRQEAKPIAFDEGYSKGYRKGFEEARPGTPTKLTGATLTFYKILVWAGALKILGSLLLAATSLFANSNSATEAVGKIIFSVFGAVIMLVLVIYFSISATVVDSLLAPAPSTLPAQLSWICGTAVFMYFFLEVLFRVCSADSHRPKAEAWSMAVIASLISLLAPILTVFWERVPEVTLYIGANLLIGVLLGGLYWVGNSALNHRLNTARIGCA